MARMGAPVGTPGKGPLDPAISMWEYGRGFSESTPCCIEKKSNSTNDEFVFFHIVVYKKIKTYSDNVSTLFSPEAMMRKAAGV